MMTHEQAEKYVNSVRWQFAKTYLSAPHEYTVLDWKRELHATMVEFAYFVKINGYSEIFGKSAFRCYKIGKFKYWTMDDPWDKTDLINRTFADDSRRSEVALFCQSPDFQYKSGMSLSDVEAQMEAANKAKRAEIEKLGTAALGDGFTSLFGEGF